MSDPNCPYCEALAVQLDGAEREIAAWRIRYAALAADDEEDARLDPLWEEAKELFDYWRDKCHHGKARFNAARFREVRPFLRVDGAALCRRAIDGAAFDCFETHNKNGKLVKHNGWDLIFRKGRKQFDSFLTKAPRLADPGELMELAESVLERMPEDDRSTPDRIWDAVEQAKELFRTPAEQARLAQRERMREVEAQRNGASTNGGDPTVERQAELGREGASG